MSENNSINEDKISEMRQLMEKYHGEKRLLEEKYQSKISQQEVCKHVFQFNKTTSKKYLKSNNF